MVLKFTWISADWLKEIEHCLDFEKTLNDSIALVTFVRYTIQSPDGR
jgi:hypothetical protein